MVNGNVPLPHGGGAMGSARPGMSPSLLRRFASSPKLTQSIVSSRNPFNHSPPSSATMQKSSRASTQNFGKGSTGTAKLSIMSSASNVIRREQRQKAELYGTLPKRKTQSQSHKPGRELPKIPTSKKPSLTKENIPQKKNSLPKTKDQNADSKKLSQSSILSNTENPKAIQDNRNVQNSEDNSTENVWPVKSVENSRKTSTVDNLDEIPVPGSIIGQDGRTSKLKSGSASPVDNMERDSLSPEPKEVYKFTNDKDAVVDHKGKVLNHMDIVRRGYSAFFSIEKTSPFDVPPPKTIKDENFNNIQAEAEKIVDSLENSREKTPSVVEENRKSQSRATSVRSQTPQRSTSQISGSNKNALRKSSQVNGFHFSIQNR